MKAIYRVLKENYRIQSGYSPCGNVFSVGNNQLALFFGEVLECVDTEEEQSGKLVLNISSIDRTFIAVNTGKSGPTNPAKFLIRCQFMEMIIRCAVIKFKESGKVSNELAAVERFIEDHLSLAP